MWGASFSHKGTKGSLPQALWKMNFCGGAPHPILTLPMWQACDE